MIELVYILICSLPFSIHALYVQVNIKCKSSKAVPNYETMYCNILFVKCFSYKPTIK